MPSITRTTVVKLTSAEREELKSQPHSMLVSLVQLWLTQAYEMGVKDADPKKQE